jgi:hypothetical protein
MMHTSMMVSLREQALARTRSGDVSPEPPPFLQLQKAVGPGGCGPCWKMIRRSRSD